MPSKYFDDELVTFIAAGLPALPHPDGRARMFPAHATNYLGDTDAEQAVKSAMNQDTAEAFINYLQANGRQIVTDAELVTPQQYGEHTIVTAHCATCAGVLITAIMSRDGRISIPPRAIDPDCGTRHGAA